MNGQLLVYIILNVLLRLSWCFVAQCNPTATCYWRRMPTLDHAYVKGTCMRTIEQWKNYI